MHEISFTYVIFPDDNGVATRYMGKVACNYLPSDGPLDIHIQKIIRRCYNDKLLYMDDEIRVGIIGIYITEPDNPLDTTKNERYAFDFYVDFMGYAYIGGKLI